MACVASESITGATFSHWAAIAERADKPHHRDPAAEPTKTEMRQTLGYLISLDWVFDEAAALHISVSAAAVRHRFDKLRAEEYPKARAFRRFLTHTGYTVSDLLLRVRLQMLSSRIEQRVVGHSGARSQQRRLARFVREFQDRWKAQTYCQTAYATPDCGHIEDTL